MWFYFQLFSKREHEICCHFSATTFCQWRNQRFWKLITRLSKTNNHPIEIIIICILSAIWAHFILRQFPSVEQIYVCTYLVLPDTVLNLTCMPFTKSYFQILSAYMISTTTLLLQFLQQLVRLYILTPQYLWRVCMYCMDTSIWGSCR